MAPMLFAGAAATAIAMAPVATADAIPAGMASGGVAVSFEPGGGGCVDTPAGPVCGSGGTEGPGGGPGGSGCVDTPNGPVCGSGGTNQGPGGIPGGSGCVPGVGCGSGHG